MRRELINMLSGTGERAATTVAAIGATTVTGANRRMQGNMAERGTVPRESEGAGGSVFQLGGAAATGLGRQLSERIRSDGPLTFATFMEAALYDAALGYYRRGAATVGRDGDFLTSPEVDPLFAYAIGAMAESVWEAADRPERFVLRDVGGGSGALMEGALRWAAVQRPEFASALWGEIVERSAPDRERQAHRLGALCDRVEWIDDVAVGEPAVGKQIVGLVVANELLDAQPVHRLRWNGGSWEELYVAVSESGRLYGPAWAGERFGAVGAAGRGGGECGTDRGGVSVGRTVGGVAGGRVGAGRAGVVRLRLSTRAVVCVVATSRDADGVSIDMRPGRILSSGWASKI